jgi:hypothetical protein
MGIAADGGVRVELQLNRTTDVNVLVTICQGKTGEAGAPSYSAEPTLCTKRKGLGHP